MSTFVVRFIGTESGTCAGIVRHVATGEEAPFAGVSELLAFFEERVPSVGVLHRILQDRSGVQARCGATKKETGSRGPGRESTDLEGDDLEGGQGLGAERETEFEPPDDG